MSYIFHFIFFLLLTLHSFKSFAVEEVDFSLHKVTEEEKVFFESFQDLYNAVRSTANTGNQSSRKLQPLVILSETEKELKFGMAQGVCRAYNVFSGISDKSCYVAKADNINKVKSLLRYGKNSPSYGDINLNADFLIIDLESLYYAQKGQGPYADLPYLNAVMMLNSKLDLFFVNIERDLPFSSLDDLVVYGKVNSGKRNKSKNKKGNKQALKVGVIDSSGVKMLLKVARDFQVPFTTNVEIVALKQENIQKRFCDTKTADIDIIFYSGEYHEETLSSFYTTCESKIAVLSAKDYGYESIKNKKFYSPVDVTNVLKYRIKKNSMELLKRDSLKNVNVNAYRKKFPEDNFGEQYQYKEDRLYVSGIPYVLAATRYTHVKDVFYVVMAYSYDFMNTKSFQPVLDTQSLSVTDLFSRALKVDDLVFHSGVTNYVDYYQAYSLATRKSEAEVELLKYMEQKYKLAENPVNNISGPPLPNGDQVNMILSGNKEIEFYEDSYLLKGLLERDFEKIREEKIYGNSTSGRFKINNIIYGVGYIELIERTRQQGMEDESYTGDDLPLDESLIDENVGQVITVPDEDYAEEEVIEEEEETIEEEEDEAVTLDPLLGGGNDLF